MPVIPALRRLRQEDVEFEASLDYVTKTWASKKKMRLHMTLLASL
jgi:hypothetical protein